MLSLEAFQARFTCGVVELAVADSAAGVVGGCASGFVYGRKTATIAYQSVAVPKVARAFCVPAALASASSMSTDPDGFCARMVNARPCVAPGVTLPGDPPVMMEPTTSSPAPTAAVAPE